MNPLLNELPYVILRKKQVIQLTGLSGNTILRRVETGTFPNPIALGGRAKGWRSIDVMAWLDQQAAAAGYNVEGK